MDIFEKCYDFSDAEEVKGMGIYPYFRAISSGQDTEVLVDGKKMIMIGSNNYLGLTSHPRVKEAALEAVKKYGSGCTGSRFLNGTLDIHEELEQRLAKFMRKEAAQVFSTGFLTNLGTIATIVNRRDNVIADRSDHASIVDACRLSFGNVIKFKHNDMTDLKRVLSSCNDDAGKLIVVDGVFSMEGDIANLPAIVNLAKQYRARVMVDDAHSIGVLGANGRGTAEHFDLEDQVDIVMGTFSKSFASLGGFIAASERVINYIKHFSRALIFSASPPPAAVAACLAALDIIEQEPERRERLWQITKKMHKGFKALGFNIGNSQTPIIPIYIGDDIKTFQFWKMLSDEGIFSNPAISPAVSAGSQLIRTSYTATHTDEQLDRVLEAFEKVGKKMGVI
ncbi:2-amino-3-ketobutyrate CoA ligase [candidate division WOR-1 bacterium DG_54_3]|uniref:2-amino-3-ketobutyrate CoA ligase n=1 Tax=candidate division WOR-1 bacterium DG_54_3 TaxID=1703775 RepID=A0A0S7XSC1_UNCSA|nr:MAG: 2-amino-3-ketobutyrate CoA ligase [candidate division WOR-1 bacterium DG_54_3]